MRVLGRGGFGVVYRAHDRRLDREVAIKVLNESCEPGSVEASSFLREARILASLDHTHIIPINPLSDCPEISFMAM